MRIDRDQLDIHSKLLMCKSPFNTVFFFATEEREKQKPLCFCVIYRSSDVWNEETLNLHARLWSDMPRTHLCCVTSLLPFVFICSWRRIISRQNTQRNYIHISWCGQSECAEIEWEVIGSLRCVWLGNLPVTAAATVA